MLSRLKRKFFRWTHESALSTRFEPCKEEVANRILSLESFYEHDAKLRDAGFSYEGCYQEHGPSIYRAVGRIFISPDNTFMLVQSVIKSKFLNPVHYAYAYSVVEPDIFFVTGNIETFDSDRGPKVHFEPADRTVDQVVERHAARIQHTLSTVLPIRDRHEALGIVYTFNVRCGEALVNGS